MFALLAFAGGARAANELIFLSGFEDCAPAFADADGDGWGDELRGTDNCTRPASYVVAFGDCNDGEQTVHPGAPDAPDASFGDANCDGIDGDVVRAAFVAPGGVDGPACSIDAPCATVAHALARVAADSARDHVYVQAGQYAGHVDLVASEAVFGGYDASWMRADRDAPGHASIIQGGVRANGIVASDGNAPMLENLVVLGPDGAGAEASSIAVRISASSGVVLARLR
ncbi:MAG TPA: putative metal-binding motif-containing protein, partial [Candidatus Saccharimonadia bacterium]|nr:putative metal-binding motif-containing protein [Candidatus Saccharimonadia bacterium]